MSKIADKLRHPILDDLPELWSNYTPATFPFISTAIMLDEVPGLIASLEHKKDGDCVPYVLGSRDAAIAVSPLPYGKAVEAARAGLSAIDGGQWLGGVAMMYLANYLLARSVIQIFGVVPLGRDKKWTLDLFPNGSPVFRSAGKIDEIQVWKTDAWSHAIVWSILERILNTLKAEKDILEDVRPLKMTDWGKFPGRRNKYSYNDGYLCELHEGGDLSVPGDVVVDIRRLAADIDFRRDRMDAGYYLAVFRRLLWFHDLCSEKAGISGAFKPYGSVARTEALVA